MFTLEMVTYKGIYKTMEAQSINLPTPDGRRGILPNHMAIMFPVSIGVVAITDASGVKKYTVSDGIFYFENNKGTLLADSIEDVEYIKAEELDIKDAKVEEILRKAEKQADKILNDIK
jgi:F-type H+-transporting ATPase subunit epsilon